MLVYFLANNDNKLVNCDLNFFSEYRFFYNKVDKTLEVKKSDNYLKNYWGKDVKSVTAIAGDNGIGKTSILELIKDRFLHGFIYPDNTIIITKKDNIYELYYDESLLRETNPIIIDSACYNINSPVYNFNNETNETSFKIAQWNLAITLKKITSTEKEARDLKVEVKTRLGEDSTLIFYTNHWNYTRRNRVYKESTEQNELDYMDFSIGYKIDSAINNYIKSNILISDNMVSVNVLEQKKRFDVDYLFKIKEKEIINTLKYLKENAELENINENLIVPEEIYIFYNFLDSQIRSEFFSLNDDSKYLRFEKTTKNFPIENVIYDYILEDENIIRLNESIILAMVESLFSELDYLLPPTVKKQIKLNDSERFYDISNTQEINSYLIRFSKYVTYTIETIKIDNTNGFQEKNRNSLIEQSKNLIESYIRFIEFTSDNFIKEIDAHTTETFTFELDGKSEVTKSIKIEVPIIKLNKIKHELAYNFIVEYSKVVGQNKPLYFVWRDLSAGEIQLLNLFTSLSLAINDSKNKDILILLDEVEISLHPMLQKKFLKMLMNILNSKREKQKNIQIILTTHSPFVLSELPFNSLILLKKDEYGNVKIQESLENFTATLGANVHDLFSHSFFLTDGLIGDFAKDRINEVANYLLGVNLDLEKGYVEKFINQIGEPIIKTKLLELYNQKEELSRSNEIKKVTADIELLKEKLESLQRKEE